MGQTWGEVGESSRLWPNSANLWPMFESGGMMAESRSPMDPNRLTPAQAAKLLSAAAKVQVPIEKIERDMADGAPANADGTLSLMSYAAWLLKEMGHGD
jgi:hypothetical protein